MAKQETVHIDMKDVQEKIDKLSKTLGNPSVVFERTLKDMGSRAPGKVADAVRGVYNIKKNEITPSKKSTTKLAGNIKVTGGDIMSLKFTYEGRALTPLHFGMTPKSRPDKKRYKVKAKIKKGKPTVFEPKNEGGGVFLAPARKGSAKILAWERYSGDRYDISPIKTLSLPQMVGPNPETGQGGNPTVTNMINDSLGELLLKRLDHHLNRYLDKNLK